MNNNISNICFIGCGNLGFALVNSVCSMIYEIFNDIKKIILIDPDILEEKDKPICIFGTNKNIEINNIYVGYPKVYALEYYLKSLYDNRFDVFTSTIRFPEALTEINKFINIASVYMIDCRDTNERSSLFDIKVNCDGPYSRCVINPKNKKSDIGQSSYLIKRSKFYAELTSYMFLKYIKNGIETKNQLLNGRTQYERKEIEIILNNERGLNYEQNEIFRKGD